MTENKLLADEARRAAQYGAVKTHVENEVNAEITSRANRQSPGKAEQMDQVAKEFRGKAVDEVVATDREVKRSRVLARISQVVDYIFYAIYALLALRFLLALMAARQGAGFVQLIHQVTEPLYAPFRGIVASPSLDGGFTLALPILFALIVYALLHAGINGLLRLMAHRKTEI